MTERKTTLHTRNRFVTSKALKNFLSASILTSIAAQLAVTTDAAIVSHMIGTEAMSAINMVMPLTIVFSCFSILLGLGASVLAARAIGNHDKERVNRIFTISLFLLALSGTAVSLLSFGFCDSITGLICPDAQIHPYAQSYTEIISAGAIFLIISNGVNYFVSTDGNPGLVAKGVLTGAVANIILDIVLVRFMGIAGSAVATILNYIITLAIVSVHFFRKGSSYRLTNPFRKFGTHFAENIYEGLPLMLGNLFLGGAVFIVNKMILDAAGADGIYIWSICLQLLMITFVVLNGVGNAMLSIGGVLAGEKDYNGLHILTRLSIGLVCGVLALFVIFVLAFPEALSAMFGAGKEGDISAINSSLRIFSLLLIPFAVTLIMRFLFQVLEHRILSLLLSVGQLAFIIGSLWTFIEISPEHLWWSFPFSAVMLIVIQLMATICLHMKDRNISAITLIPARIGDEESMDLSAAYDREIAEDAIKKVEEFLSYRNIDSVKVKRLVENCKECAEVLRKHSNGKKQSFDLHVRIIKEEIHMVLRAAGKRINFDGILKGETTGLEHKYMYGLNVLFLKS